MQKPSKKPDRIPVPNSLLWVINAFDTLDHPYDTTLRFIEEALLGNCENYICDYLSISLEEDEVLADCQQVLECSGNRTADEIVLTEKFRCSPARFDLVIYRTDPPMNYSYIYQAQLLKIAFANRKEAVLNPVEQLLSSTEKYIDMPFSGMQPMSCISADWRILENFGKKYRHTIIKPLNDAQSRGVKLLEWLTVSDKEKNHGLIAKMTNGFVEPIILQEYFPSNKEEIRMWFVNGRLIASVKKIFKSGTFLFDVDCGDVLVAYELNEKEALIAAKASKHLSSNGIFFAAVDLIAGKITDFNISSPGLIVEIERVTKRNISKEVIAEMQKKIIANNKILL